MTRTYLAAACLLVAAALPGHAATPPCRSQPNETLAQLLACIKAPDLWRHLAAFQQIADNNPDKQGHGNRDTGTAGYQQSVAYVAGLMQQAGYTVTIQTYTIGAGAVPGRGGPHGTKPGALAAPIEDYNLIAESPYGDPAHTIVVDAHLDSIYGAGMLDNASGATTILEVALKLAKTHTRNRLRYVWFGGEEIGLFGSRYYTQHLSAAERKQIAFDLDVDVTATPNFDILVADPGHAPNKQQFPPNVVPQSRRGNDLFLDYFRTVGAAATLASFGNEGTDSNNFSLVGIPNSGILTNQDCCKRAWEVKLWGGFRGNYEGKIPSFNGGCVDRPHRWCDNLTNNDPFIFELVSKGVAYTIWKLAQGPA